MLLWLFGSRTPNELELASPFTEPSDSSQVLFSHLDSYLLPLCSSFRWQLIKSCSQPRRNMACSFWGISGPRLTTILSWVFHSVLRDGCLTPGAFSIVAVHGLGGNWQGTWTAENGKLWLRDFLPLQLPSARIMSYGYDSRTFFTQSTENITDIATNLLVMLRTKRQHVAEKARPIIVGLFALPCSFRSPFVDSTCSLYGRPVRAAIQTTIS